MWSAEPGASDTDPVVPLRLRLALPGPPVSDLWVHGAVSADVTLDGTTAVVDAVVAPWHDVTVVVTMESADDGDQSPGADPL